MQRYIEKIPVFEAAQWTTDTEKIIEISGWLGQSGWPLLTQSEVDAPPSPARKQGHFLNEDGTLRIQWPEDRNDVPVGHWVVLGKRYNDIRPWSDEAFNFTYDQYGS